MLFLLFSFQDLIDRLLVVDASERYRAEEILKHSWIKVNIYKRIRADLASGLA